MFILAKISKIMKIKRNIILVILSSFFLFFHADLYAQKKSRKVIKADNAFELEEYAKAAELYQKAYSKVKDKALKVEIIFRQAECYRLSGNIKRSETYYKRAIRAKYPNAKIYLRYADVLMMQGDYKNASTQYKEYLQKCGITKREADQLAIDDIRREDYLHGEMGLRSCNFALKWKDVPTRYKVYSMPLLNSRNSDYSPAFGNSNYTELYFTSSRKGGVTDKIDNRTGEIFTDIYHSKLNKKGVWSKPIHVAEPLNSEGNEGSVYVNESGNTMYLTKCKVEKKKNLGCGIYVSKREGKLWSEPKLLQIKIDSNITIGHPTLSKDEKILIFSSDMPNGYGGKDLWMVKKEKRNIWSKPENLGPLVNSRGDEMFPFLHSDGTIYFASTGHVGMGGLDIYKTNKDENGAYILPINLKTPINSPGDDFCMIIEENGERGYLTSNREGGKGRDDIYQFELPPLVFSVKGIITDSKTGSILSEANVKIIGSDGSVINVVSDNTGSFESPLKPLTSYEIIVNKSGYIKQSVNETTFGVEQNKVFEIDILVDPEKKKIILPRIEYDFAKSDLRIKSTLDLDVLAEGLLDNTNVVIELVSHTDELGSISSNLELAKKRGDACVDYLLSKGVDPGQIKSRYVGENEPHVIDIKVGNFNVGDVLTKSYINSIKSKEDKEKAHQYNRRTIFNILRDDYVPNKNDELKRK